MPLKILAFDTSTAAFSVALTGAGNGAVLDFFKVMPRQQAAHILPLIEKTLLQADIALKQLDAIAFANGPGSFTGVRLAASVAQGLALGADVAIVPISTLHAMALGAYYDFQAEKVLVITDAHSGDVYCGAYQWDGGQMQPIVAEQRCKPGQIAGSFNDFTGIGDGWGLYPELLPSISTSYPTYYPHAKWVAKLAEIALTQGLTVTPENIAPAYLHQADAWKRAI